MAQLSKRTFGVEFELFFTEDGWDRFEHDFSRYIDDDDYDSEEARGFLHIQRVLISMGLRNWKVVEDASIENDSSDGVEAEIVTPKLQGTDGLKQIYKFCKVFSKYAQVNQSTGVHVHVDAADFNNADTAAERLTMALLHFGNLEQVFDSLVMAHRRGDETYYARRTAPSDQIIERYREVVTSQANQVDRMVDLLQGYTRYQKINIQAIKRHGTIEFRQMHGTLNPELVKNWIIICMAFLDQIIETEKVFTNMFHEIKEMSISAANKIDASFEAKRTTLTVVLYHFKSIISSIALGYLNMDEAFELQKIMSREKASSLVTSNVSYTNILPNQKIGSTMYMVGQVPIEQYEKLFLSGDYKENIQALISVAQKRDDLIRNCIFTITPSSVIIKIKLSYALKKDRDLSGKETDLGPVPGGEELAASVKSNPIQLPQRNINKLRQQTATRPLKETKKK